MCVGGEGGSSIQRFGSMAPVARVMTPGRDVNTIQYNTIQYDEARPRAKIIQSSRPNLEIGFSSVKPPGV